MPFLNLGALKDFEKPQGAESSPKKNVKVSIYLWKLNLLDPRFIVGGFAKIEVFNEVQPSKWFYSN